MTSLSTNLLAVSHPIASVKPDPRNPRQHSPRQIRQIARSIESFGFNVPILIDRQNQILCGHGRYQAALSLGMQEIPVISLEHLTPEQARAFAIADNRLTELAVWDETALGEIFAELSALDLDFQLEDTGFTIGEIDLKIEALTLSNNAADPADAIPEHLGPAVTELGDLWMLDEHRLLCGDAREADSYTWLMAGRRAALVFIDPPYNVPIQGHVSGGGGIRHREFAMASGEMSSAEFTQFLTRCFELLATHCNPGGLHFVCMDWRHLPETLAAGAVAYNELKNLCVWVKDRGGMGSLYRSQHELVLVFKHDTAPHRNNVELGRHGRNRTNVWQYPCAGTLSRQAGGDNLLALHPTVKPVALIADALLDCSARRDIVLDTFLGSGSTLLAAQRVGRLCYGMEIDPLYIDTAIRRWQQLTGASAIHAESGQSFNDRQSAKQSESDHE